MKFIKIITLIFTIFLITGCSVNYNLTINNDLTVTEKIMALESNELLSYLGITPKEYVKSSIDNYTAYDEYKQYHYNELYLNNNSGVEIYITYNSIQEYLNKSPWINYGYTNIEKNIDDKSISFKADYITSEGEDPLAEELTINIEIPFFVKNHNADSTNQNIYTWILNNDTNEHNIMFGIDLTKKADYNPYIFIIIIIILIISIIATISIYIHKRNNNI